MAKSRQNEKSIVMRAPNHKKYYVTNILGGLTDQDFRFELLNEKIKNEDTKGWGYISDSQIILTPIGAKRLFESLKKNLDVWENEHGKIDIGKKDNHIIEVNKK